MVKKKKNYLIPFLSFLIFAFVIIIYSSDVFDLSIKSASPMMILPLLTAYSFFGNLRKSVTAGLICGGFIDSVSHGTYCFNTLVLMLLCVLIHLLANNLFNKNINAAVCLSFIFSTLYFVLLWLCFYGINATLIDSVGYLLKYALPSAFYSALFIFPFYFIYKKFSKSLKH